MLWTECQWKALHRDWFGVSSSVVHQNDFRDGEREGHIREAFEGDGRLLRQRAWRGQLEVAGDGLKHSPTPLGGEKVGKPTDRGKLGTKINLMVDGRGAPISVILTSANRHHKVSALDLIVSVVLKRPAGRSQEQHLCADKAYDS